MAAAPPPITRGESIFRRIPLKQGWVDPQGIVSPNAFLPNKGDKTSGVSVSRAVQGETSAQAAQRIAATGNLGTEYLVAEIPAARLLDANIPVAPDPMPHDVTHAEMKGWTYDRRDDQALRTAAEKTASSVTAVHGPYPGQKPKVQPLPPPGAAAAPAAPAPAAPTPASASNRLGTTGT